MGHIDSLLWQQAQMAGTGNAKPSDGNGHDFFIPKDMVLRARAKDVTYGLITCLIRPEKTDEPNRKRLVAGGDRVHYPFDAGTPTQVTCRQATHQQRDLHTQGKILHNGYREFLLMYSHDEVQVHALKTLQHARRHHRTLPPP
jgi:hypothetical protein